MHVTAVLIQPTVENIEHDEDKIIVVFRNKNPALYGILSGFASTNQLKPACLLPVIESIYPYLVSMAAKKRKKGERNNTYVHRMRAITLKVLKLSVRDSAAAVASPYLLLFAGQAGPQK